MKANTLTKRWMRDASDELAVANGCYFDEGRGQFAVDWMEDYLYLYEGEQAGEPFKCVDDWQYDTAMRAFGWVRESKDWGRTIRRFRASSVWIPKKNKKSPTLAAWVCYLAFGDGELGQKVFPAAKDGAQVRENVMRHIHEMIGQSPQLRDECKINKSNGQVFHAETRSLIMPLSSDNASSQKSKEGLNGSPAKDEVHVVDDAFNRRISRATISRAEPLDMEFSTVGNDMDSYGFRRFQYCEGVIRGDIKDDATLAVIYACPANLSDEELDADPVKYGKLANPAWGHTIKETEFLADYNRSKTNPRDLADFKMYRLNIWQSSATPWLDMLAWDNCPSKGELIPGEPSHAGLDLSSKRDFTGWSICQRQGDVIVCRGHAWITERRAREHNNVGLPVYQWEDEGWLTIIPGERIDYEIVQSRVLRDCETYGIDSVAHDPWNAEETRQKLEAKGVNMVEVPQTFASFSDPCKSVEVAILAREFDHGGNPLLRWFAQNTVIKTDANDNIRPVKPERSSMKAIDGMVAAIMGVSQLGEPATQSTGMVAFA